MIRSEGEVIGVFCLTRKGNLLIESKVREPIFDLVVEACKQERPPLKGVVGNWEFCSPFWQYLKQKKIIQKELFASKEILYSINMQKQKLLPQSQVRFLTQADYDQWKPLRLAYLIEEGVPNDLTDSQLEDLFFDKTKNKIAWSFFQNDTLVSIADLNAKAFDLGQVGGVYTSPLFRRKGYSKAVMKQLLHDAKEYHFLRKLIIFTGEKNFSAQCLYTSLGVFPIGFFSLLFGESS